MTVQSADDFSSVDSNEYASYDETAPRAETISYDAEAEANHDYTSIPYASYDAEAIE